MKRSIAIGFILVTCQLHAQDSIVQFNSVEVMSVRIAHSERLISNQLVLADPTSSFSNLLQKESGIYIKSQGNAALNTAAYQGFGASHLPVFIEGMNLQSTMNSTFDLSLLSSYHFNQFSFSSNPENTLGSPNLGPGLSLRSSKHNGLSVLLGASSLRLYDVGLKWGRSTSKWRTHVSYHTSVGPNKYDISHYPERATAFTDKFLDNTRVEKHSGVATIQNLSPKTGYWKSTLYIGYGERDLPESLLATSSASQDDVNILFGNQFTFGNYRKSLILKNQIRREAIGYFSRFQSSKNLALSSSTTAEGRMTILNGLTLKAGVGNEVSTYYVDHVTSQSIKETAIDTNYSRMRAWIGAEQKWQNTSIQISGQAQNGISPMVYNGSVSISHKLPKYILLNLLLAKNYRLPSMNDLFWDEPFFAKGNPNLKAEEGYRSSLSILFQDKGLTIGINPFLAQSNDLIVWALESPLGLWQPTNIRQVSMHGMSNRIQLNAKIDGVQFSAMTRYNWSVARYVSDDTAVNNNQLIFTPEHTWNATLSVAKNRIGCHINLQRVGKNYIQSDNEKYLDPYVLLSAGATYRTKKMSLGLQADNLTHQAYFSIPNQPLPGRRIKLTISYRIK